MKKILIPPVFLLIAFLSILGVRYYLPAFNKIPYPMNWVGVLLIIPGFAIIGKARMLFKKHQTSLTIKKPSHFVLDGPYARTRNPIYVGMILFLTGLSICSRNLLALGVPILFFAVIHSFVTLREERIMEATFGEEYLEYKRKVRRWI